MDQFSAHMDRGWDLVQRGDVAGAEASARRALALDSESPEAHNLLGFVAALKGDFDQASDHYDQAIALDDTYLDAILNAAELRIHPLGRFEEAERLCDEALDLAEQNGERIDAMLLKFDALIGQGRVDAARRLALSFPEGPFDNPVHGLLIGRALFEVGEVQRAAPLIENAASPGEDAEASYYLALVRDRQGRDSEATAAFLDTRALDFELPAPDWSLTRQAFRQAVEEAVAGLSAELRRFIRPSEVYVDLLPGAEVIVDGVDPRAMLLLDEVSVDSTSMDSDDSEPSDAESTGSGPTDTEGTNEACLRLFVYQRNVERAVGGVELLVSELTEALTSELEAFQRGDSADD